MSQVADISHPDFPFLKGGGEMGELIRAFDWSATPLGPPETWPVALKIITGIMLSSPFPMHITWGDQFIQLYNDGYRPVLGEIKHPQALGIPIWESFPEIWDTVGPMFHGVMVGRAVRFPDFKLFLERNGYVEECYFDFAYSPIKDENGIVGGVLTTEIETTEKIIVRNHLAAERDKLRSFLMQAPAGICVLDGPELIYELVNPVYQQLLPNRKLQGRPVFEALPEIIGTPLQDVMLNVYYTGAPYQVNELSVPLAEQEGGPTRDRYFTFNYLARRNEADEVDGILVFVFEVTELVNSRKKVEQAEESLRMAIDAAELGSFYINTEDRIFHPSARLKEFFGFDPDEEVSFEAAIKQIHEDYRQAAADLVEAAITKGIRFDMEYPVAGHNDGTIRWVRGIGEVQHDTDGKTYFAGVLHEITERKLDEIRKNDFIGMVSHELKTPLTSLNAYLQILSAKATKSGDVFTTDALEKSMKQVKKMIGMINGFLNVSRLEARKIHIEKQLFDMADLLREVKEESLVTITSHKIIFAPMEPILIIADKEKISLVIHNLISNAVKYSPKGSTVNVACVIVNNNAQISVNDQGLGISSNDIKRLFDRYFRVQSNYTKHIPGFGIGLYLSSEIITGHKGKIWVDSEIGKGSTFYFSIPTVTS